MEAISKQDYNYIVATFNPSIGYELTILLEKAFNLVNSDAEIYDEAEYK